MASFRVEEVDGGQDAQVTAKVKVFKREDEANWLSKLFFVWFMPVIRHGFHGSIQEESLGGVSRSDEPSMLYERFCHAWEEELARCRSRTIAAENLEEEDGNEERKNNQDQVKKEKKKGEKKDKKGEMKPSMVRTMLKVVGYDKLVIASILSAVQASCLASVPFVSKKFLENLANPLASNTEQGWLAAALVIVPLIGAYAQAQVTYISRRGSMHLYTALTQAIFNKSLRLSAASRNTSSSGQLVNLIATDAGTALERSILLIYPLFLAPILLGVSLYLIYREVGVSLFAGIGLMVFVIPLNLKIFIGLTRVYRKTINVADDRIKLVNEALQAIRILKMYAWELPFAEKIRQMREKELVYLRKHAYLFSVGMNAVFLQLPYLIQFATFTTYYFLDNLFLPWTIFTAIQLFQLLQQQLTQLPSAISQLSQTLVAANRISTFLQLPELVVENREAIPPGETQPLPRGSVRLSDAAFTWDVETESNTLSELTMNVVPGEKVAIIGKVASGKSSLLLALSGELRRAEGSCFVSGNIAYSAQQPFALSMTLKENILFGKPLKPERYSTVVKLCCLEDDLAIMPFGEDTFIGERGINLSGGQKARVSLARAVYADADVVLLDDPLSAVDAHVGKAILDGCIFGPLLKDKTVFFTTNKLDRLSDFDRVLVVEGGKIVQQGKWEDIVNVDESMLAPQASSEPNAERGEEDIEQVLDKQLGGHEKDVQKRDQSDVQRPVSELAEEDPGKKDELYAEEEEEVGTLKLSVLSFYIKAISRRLFYCGYGLYLVYLFTPLCSQYILSFWSDEVLCEIPGYSYPGEDCSRKVRGESFWYLAYCLVLVGGLFVCIVAGILIAQARVNGSRNLHNMILESAFRASITEFFDVNPLGRVVNRFAKDMSIIDFPLSQMFMFAFVTLGYSAAGLVGIVLGTDGWFLIFLFPIIILYLLMYVYLRKTAIQLQRLEAKARSPIYSNFAEVLNGLKTIRGFRQQDRFITKNRNTLTSNILAYFLARVVLPSFLMVSVNIFGAIIMTIVCVFVLATDTIAPGQAGLALTYALQISQTMNATVMVCTEVEITMNSVERVKSFIDNVEPEDPIDKEEKRRLDEAKVKRKKKNKLALEQPAPVDVVVSDGDASSVIPDPSWPQAGEVIVEDLVVGYRKGPDVLHGVTFHIQPGEKVGILGRTGSGKSSLLLAMLRIVEPRSGSVKIDGVDISRLHLRELRSRIAIIPQTPVVFQATLRFNLDPFEVYSDEELNATLESVQLSQFVGNLDMELVEGGDNVSEGQRQLICFARAILRKSRLLMLDEASAMLDKQTDQLLQTLVRKVFVDRTVLTIAHRLDTILDSTRVLVLDSGSIAEFDAPQTLLANPESIFAQMVAADKLRATAK